MLFSVNAGIQMLGQLLVRGKGEDEVKIICFVPCRGLAVPELKYLLFCLSRVFSAVTVELVDKTVLFSISLSAGDSKTVHTYISVAEK